MGTARIEQLALARFLTRGDLDRHLRRMRIRYRARRDAMVAALAAELPEAAVTGIAAGLHVTVALPADDDAEAIRRAAAARGLALSTMADYTGPAAGGGHPPTLILGYSQLTEARIRGGIRELAAVIGTTRRGVLR